MLSVFSGGSEIELYQLRVGESPLVAVARFLNHQCTWIDIPVRCLETEGFKFQAIYS